MAKKKYIETPEKLYDLFNEYKRVTNRSDKWIKFQYVGKDGDRVTDPLKPPLTIEGFENFVADKGLNQDLGDYFSNNEGRYSEYTTICSRIRREIREDQITGGMLGFYNPSITQRLNGLADKTSTTIHVEQPLFKDEE